MKISNSKERLKEMMSVLDLKPVDICKKCGIQKSSLSNYLNGTREPRQDQISLICDPFGINPAWLMGYDVPMYFSTENSSDIEYAQIKRALAFYEKFANLSDEKKLELQHFLDFLQS